MRRLLTYKHACVHDVLMQYACTVRERPKRNACNADMHSVRALNEAMCLCMQFMTAGIGVTYSKQLSAAAAGASLWVLWSQEPC